MFEADVAAFRPRLFGLAYRMLGARTDADDVVQEAFVRWQSADRTAIRDPQAWLVTTTTRAAIDRLRTLQVERRRYTGPWIPEPIVLDAAEDPEQHVQIAESLSVAFLHVLERLAPDERAAFILHDVFGYPHVEIAAIIGRTHAAVRQMVHRARERVRASRPRFSLDRQAAAALVERFVRAFESGDESELYSVLAEDVVHLADGGGTVAASRQPVIGRDRVVRLLFGVHAKFWAGARFERAEVGGAPGLIVVDDEGKEHVVIAFATNETAIVNLYVVVAPEKIASVFAEPPPAIERHIGA